MSNSLFKKGQTVKVRGCDTALRITKCVETTQDGWWYEICDKATGISWGAEMESELMATDEVRNE